jgi:hypothetical protein
VTAPSAATVEPRGVPLAVADLPFGSAVRRSVLRGFALAALLEAAFVLWPLAHALVRWHRRPPGELALDLLLGLLVALAGGAWLARPGAPGGGRFVRALSLGRWAQALLAVALAIGTVDAVRGLDAFGMVSLRHLLTDGSKAFALWLVGVATALVELWAARPGVRRRAHVGVALLVTAVAAPALAASMLQADYLDQVLSVLRSGRFESFVASAATLRESLEWMGHHPEGCAIIALASALPFGACALARLRRWSLLGQTAAVLAACGALSFPILAIARSGFLAMEKIGAALALGGALLPLAAWIADRLELAILRALVREDLLPSPAPLPRRRSILLAVLATGALVYALTLASERCLARRTYVAPPPPPAAAAPVAEGLVRSFAAWREGRLPPDAIAELVASTVSLSYHARPVLRPVDRAFFGREASFTGPPGYSLGIRSSVLLDGAVPPSLPEGSNTGYFGGGEARQQWGRGLLGIYQYPAAKGPAVGRHEVRWRSDLWISPGEGAESAAFWRESREEVSTFVVDPNADPPVRLVDAPLPESALRLECVDEGSDGPAVHATLGSSAVSFAGTFRVRADPTAAFRLASPPWCCYFVPAGDAERGRNLRAWLPSFERSGYHEVTVRFVPDPGAALGESVTVEEIYGRTIDRKIVVWSW